jgi:cysteine desulfurase
MADPVYLDYAATTPVDPRISARITEVLQSEFGNPSSATHGFGERAQRLVDLAAEQVAGLIGARGEEIIWTSGATESDNLAIIGAAKFREMRGKHIVTVATEHKAVLEACAHLEREGFGVTYLRPDAQGVVAPEAVAAALTPATVLVSVMHANNEIGVVQDVAAIGAVCREADVLFHVDAAQSVGKLVIDVEAMRIDLLSMNAHKACGPKGIGALYMNAERMPRVEPLLYGGGQQRALRPGTLPVHQIAGMGATLEILGHEMDSEVLRLAGLRDRLWAGIADLPGVTLNGHPDRRLCSILNVSVADAEGESLLLALDDLAVASGSACNSANAEPSYVLRSLGLSDRAAEASIRFSVGRFTTEADIDRAIDSFARATAHLQSLARAESA